MTNPDLFLPCFTGINIDSASVCIELRRGDLTDNGATPWSAAISLGSPVQNLKFMIDTGTTHTWVTAEACSTDACNAHDKFDPVKSQTYTSVSDPDKPVSIDFGPWGQLLAVMGSDDFSMSPRVKLDQMRFYLAINYSGSQFQELACDGGIAIPSVNPVEPNGANDLTRTMLHKSSYSDSDQILEKLTTFIGGRHIATFSFSKGCSNEDAGVCIFGQCDIGGKGNCLPVIKSGLYYMLWTVCLENIQYNSQKMLRNINFILDTGSSRFKGDPEYISTIIKKITDNGRLPEIVTEQRQLDLYHDLTLMLQGVSYLLTPEHYFLKIKNKEDEWEWHLAFHPMTGMDNYLLVGSVFLDTVVSSFNYDKGTVTIYKKDEQNGRL